jgi:hypothetical protein
MRSPASTHLESARCAVPPSRNGTRTPIEIGSAGVTRTSAATYTVLPPMICAGAMNVGSDSIPAWQQAAGVWMLVHEAFHLRHWRFRRNEAKVGCQTIVYFTDAAARLGASDPQAQQLYPYGLALHELELDLYPWHRDPKCIVPPWLPPSGP